MGSACSCAPVINLPENFAVSFSCCRKNAVRAATPEPPEPGARPRTNSGSADIDPFAALSGSSAEPITITPPRHITLAQLLPARSRKVSYLFCAAETAEITLSLGDGATTLGLTPDHQGATLDELPPHIELVLAPVVHSALAGAHQQVHLTFRNRNLVVCGYPVVDPDGRVLSALLVVRPMPPHDRALRNRLSTLVSSV